MLYFTYQIELGVNDATDCEAIDALIRLTLVRFLINVLYVWSYICDVTVGLGFITISHGPQPHISWRKDNQTIPARLSVARFSVYAVAHIVWTCRTAAPETCYPISHSKPQHTLAK